MERFFQSLQYTLTPFQKTGRSLLSIRKSNLHPFFWAVVCTGFGGNVDVPLMVWNGSCWIERNYALVVCGSGEAIAMDAFECRGISSLNEGIQ